MVVFNLYLLPEGNVGYAHTAIPGRGPLVSTDQLNCLHKGVGVGFPCLSPSLDEKRGRTCVSQKPS